MPQATTRSRLAKVLVFSLPYPGHKLFEVRFRLFEWLISIAPTFSVGHVEIRGQSRDDNLG